jgi:uncharacterized protein YndB with AHSA1/START domain
MDSGTLSPSLTLVRDFKASPEKVWAAWTSTEALKRWMSPSDNHATLLVEVDLRVGGPFRILMRAPDGKDHDASGVYRTIRPYRTLEFTWAWRKKPEQESLVLLEFEPTASGTRLTLTHSQLADQDSVDQHMKGWTGCLNQLDKFVAA